MAQPPTMLFARPAPPSKEVASARASPMPVPPKVAFDWMIKVAAEPTGRVSEAMRRSCEKTAPLPPWFTLKTLKPATAETAPMFSTAATLDRPQILNVPARSDTGAASRTRSPR